MNNLPTQVSSTHSQILEPQPINYNFRINNKGATLRQNALTSFQNSVVQWLLPDTDIVGNLIKFSGDFVLAHLAGSAMKVFVAWGGNINAPMWLIFISTSAIALLFTWWIVQQMPELDLILAIHIFMFICGFIWGVRWW